MIITRGFNSQNIITRGYGINIIFKVVNLACVFMKGYANTLFKKSKIEKLFKRGC